MGSKLPVPSCGLPCWVQWHWKHDILHNSICTFYFLNVIGLVQQIVRFLMQTVLKASFQKVSTNMCIVTPLLMNTVSYCTAFCHTSQIEHIHALKRASISTEVSDLRRRKCLISKQKKFAHLFEWTRAEFSDWVHVLLKISLWRWQMFLLWFKKKKKNSQCNYSFVHLRPAACSSIVRS